MELKREKLFDSKQWLRLAVILLPLMQAGVIALFYWLKYKTALPMPQWNDEGAYYELIKTWLATGQPLGYWGFDGGHAIVGTGSAWSPAILLPYAVFGMMFGWNYSSVFFANIVFLMLAQILFLLLVKPEKKQLVRIVLLQAVSVMILLYTTTLMSEMLRFSLAIILAGMFYRLYFRKSGKLFKYVVLPLYLLALVQIYIFFVFAVPLYVFGAFKEWKWWKKALLAFAALAVVGGGSYYLLHLISSNYNIYKTENLLKSLQAFDILGVIRSVLFMVKDGLHGLWSCFLTGTGHGLFKWFVPFLLLLIALPGVKLCIDAWKWTKEKNEKFWTHDRILQMQIVFGVALFLGAFITVYSMEPFTFFRSLCIVVLFSMYLLVMTERKGLFAILLGVYALGMLFLPVNMQDFSAERYPGKDTVAQWDALATKLEDVIELKEAVDPWENTVAVFTLEPKVLASMPAGCGVNMMLYSEEIPADAEYLFFSKEKENLRSDWLEHDHEKIVSENREVFSQYEVVWENEEYILYKRLSTNSH